MTAQLGSLEIPVEPGEYLSELADPTLLLLLSYLGHQLKLNLDSKLAQLSPTSADACPVANRYPWNPDSTFVRQSLPALFAWEERCSRRQHTLLNDTLDREIRVLYIFDELVKPDGMRARHGLASAVGKILAMAAERNQHATFSYDGSAPGACVSDLGNWLGFIFMRGEAQWLQAVPGGSDSVGGDGGEMATQRAYLGYLAEYVITEQIGQDEPTEAMGDTLLTIYGSDGEVDEGVELMQRWFPAPDGSED